MKGEFVPLEDAERAVEAGERIAALEARFAPIGAGSQPVLGSHWLIKGLLPADAMATLIGRPGCKKSFLALDMAMHVAFGSPWRGRKVLHRSVLYVGSESGTAGANRVHAWLQHHGREWPDRFLLSPVSLDLSTSAADARALVDFTRARLPDCGLVVFDTLARNLRGDENSGADMGRLLGNVEMIRQSLGCTVALVHHVGKDDARGARGHSSLLGAVSCEIRVESPPGELAGTMRVSKQRDGADGLTFAFEAKRVLLGHDDDGDEVASLVAVPGEASADPFLGVSFADLVRVQSLVSEGNSGEGWRSDPQSPAWAGLAIADVLGLDAAILENRKRCKSILDRWLAEGLFRLVNRPDRKSRWRAFVEVGRIPADDESPPGTVET
jgi:hypothetical protein